jgi:hypothetical protein
MIKVLWFLKRAEGLDLETFRAWWLDHAADVLAHQSPHLAQYKVNIRDSDSDTLPGAPAESCEWDGIAEQWFATEADFAAAYDRPASPTRSDTLAHTSRFTRLIVRETVLA